jgi:triosephosphate isomerase
MSRKKIVAGNWKMNTSLDEAIHLIQNIVKLSDKTLNIQKIIFPPFTFITSVNQILKDVPNFYVGAQNCSEHQKGAYTGEISANMLNSINCNYVIVGHSERREYFNETNKQLILKIKNALQNNIKVIFCFGEKLEHRQKNLHFETVKQQLIEVLSDFTEIDLHNIILAYEPIWAIGTGETATPHQVQEIHAYLRTVISSLFSPQTAQSISILYGGSCNAQNAKQLFSCTDVDGGLIGGASLKAEDFNTIIESF